MPHALVVRSEVLGLGTGGRDVGRRVNSVLLKGLGLLECFLVREWDPYGRKPEFQQLAAETYTINLFGTVVSRSPTERHDAAQKP